MFFSKSIRSILALGSFFILVCLFVVFNGKSVSAAGILTRTSVRLSRHSVSATPKVLIVIRPTNATQVSSIKIGFSAAQATATATDFGISNTNILTASTAAADDFPSLYQNTTLLGLGIQGGTAASLDVASSYTQAVFNVVSTTTSTSSLYGFIITAGITNPSGANANLPYFINTYSAAGGGGTNLDTGTGAVATVSSGADLVTVTATVGPTFNFALNTNTAALGTLSTTSVNTAAVTATITTNAANGWTTHMKSANGYLLSSATGGTIATQGTIDDTTSLYSSGNDWYQFSITSITQGSGSLGTRTVAAEYNGNGGSTGGTFSTNYQEIGRSSGVSGGDILNMRIQGAVKTTGNAATDYTDTLTFVGAGLF